jgi:ATP-dependent Clp protease adaptor protein ClpS
MEKIQQETEVKDEVKDTNALILFNDPVNSFEHVIRSLQGVLGWTPQQAEQAAHIAHYKGKYKLKEGDEVDLTILKYQFDDLDLTTEVQ